MIDGIFIDDVSTLWPDPSFDSRETVLSVYSALIEYI